LVPPVNPSKPQPRNPGIDLLRGLSILLVMLNHIGIRIRLTQGILATFLPKRFLNDISFNGSEAVDLFFVISGFLIASNSMARWGCLGAVRMRSFYVRRAARIVPCLIALVAILSVLHLTRIPDYVIHGPNQSLPGAVSSAFGLYLNWYEAHTGYLPASWDVLWSLSIEEVFYLAFPLVCLALRKDGLLAPLLAVLALSQSAALAAIVGNPIWKEKAYLPGMAGIAAGVLAALAAAHIPIRRPLTIRLLEFMGAAGVAAVLLFEDVLWPFLGHGTILLLTVSAACLVVAFHVHAEAAPDWKLPGTRWLQSFGRLSYEIYLTHMFVILTVVRIFRATGANFRWGVLWYIPALALAWLLGSLVARFYSTPVERALRQRFMPRNPAAITSATVAGETLSCRDRTARS
jgi:peptidoglycan/LPS O-acetylase OafA/YrhL